MLHVVVDRHLLEVMHRVVPVTLLPNQVVTGHRVLTRRQPTEADVVAAKARRPLTMRPRAASAA